MKLKRWIQYVLLIISMIALINMLLTDLEDSIIPFCMHGLIFLITNALVSELGDVYNDLIIKLERLMNK